ncbi:hypothetical protein ACFWIA_26735 [Streptomyces sp. NPDC127068]|uniref:hypothetical protein n=1 Tax=Streptomyces sp. NPDC127068 TaxID=3347127 RepID=UPI00365E8F42
MEWVVGAAVFVGGLAMTAGLVMIVTGRGLPWVRRPGSRPRLHGSGALLMGMSLVVHGLIDFDVLPDASWEVRFIGGNVLLFAGLALMAASQLLPDRNGDRNRDGVGSRGA